MLLDDIKNDSLQARKDRDTVKTSLLVPLYSEAVRVGKDNGNRQSTDEEVIAVVKKFVKNIEQTILDMEKIGRDISLQKQELSLLRNYLPKQMSHEELESAVDSIMSGLDEVTPKAMGKIMGELKTRHGGTYDGKMASQVVRNKLA